MCTHIYIYQHERECEYVYVYGRMYMCMIICTCRHAQTGVHISMLYVYACMYVYTCVYTCRALQAQALLFQNLQAQALLFQNKEHMPVQVLVGLMLWVSTHPGLRTLPFDPESDESPLSQSRPYEVSEPL